MESKELHEILDLSFNKKKLSQEQKNKTDEIFPGLTINDNEISEQIIKEEFIKVKTGDNKASLNSFNETPPKIILWHSSFIFNLFCVLNNPDYLIMRDKSLEFFKKLKSLNTVNIISSFGYDKGFDKILHSQIKLKAKNNAIDFIEMEKLQLTNPKKFVTDKDLLVMDRYYTLENDIPLVTIPIDNRVIPLAFKLINDYKISPWIAYEVAYGFLFDVRSFVATNPELSKIANIQLFLPDMENL